MDDRRTARIHEAGHCIVAHVLGMEPAGVVVLSADEGHAGRWLPTMREVYAMTRAEFEALVEAHAVVSLAGAAALEVHGDAHPWQGADDDRDAARRAPKVDPDAVYRRALTLAREHRAAIERFAETLRLNYDRIAGGHDGRIAAEAAIGNWPPPRFFDTLAEARVMERRRALFEAAYPSLGPDPGFAARWSLWNRAEAAARGGRPIRHGLAGSRWTPDQRREARAAYFRGGAGEVMAVLSPRPSIVGRA